MRGGQWTTVLLLLTGIRNLGNKGSCRSLVMFMFIQCWILVQQVSFSHIVTENAFIVFNHEKLKSLNCVEV